MPPTLAQNNATAAMRRRNESASAYLREFLERYGLLDMLPWAQEELRKGYDEVVVLQHMREQPQWQKRFKVILDREAAGLSAMSPAEVIEYERRAAQMMRSAGFPSGFYDSPEDFAGLMLADRSIEELQSVVIQSFAKVTQAPAAVRDAFREFFGVDGDTALAAFMLDPDKATPVLETEIQAGFLGGTARRFGIGMGLDVATGLARQGVTDQQAEQQLADLSQQAGLFKENVGEGEDLAIDKEGVEAAFNTSQESRQKVLKRSGERTAAFQGSGGASQGQQGASGLGVAGKP